MAEIETEVQEAPESPEVESSDLSSQIESAVDQQERRDTDEPQSKPARGPRDRFAGIKDRLEEAGLKPEQAKREARIAEPSAEATPAARPPPGFSVASRVAWDKETTTPQEWAAIKADIAKREVEVDAGFKRYGGLGKFAEEAERNGTSLQNAVNDYVQVESELRKDFIGGIEFLCRRMGVPLLAMVQGIIRKNGGAQGAAAEAEPSGQKPQQIDQNAIAAHAVSVVRSEIEQRDINRQIEDFSTDPKNKFFENVRADMAQLVSVGKAANLKDAYDAACWLNPDIRAILIEEAGDHRRKGSVAAATQARNAAKAVAGAPAPGFDSNEAVRGRIKRSLADEIRSNVAAQEAG